MEGQPPGSVIISDPWTPAGLDCSPPPVQRRLHGPYLRRKLKPAVGPLKNICIPRIGQEPVKRPLLRSARRRSSRQTDRKPDGVVKVSALMIDVIPEPVDIPVPTGFASAKDGIRNTPPLVQQMTSEDELSANKMNQIGPKYCWVNR